MKKTGTLAVVLVFLGISFAAFTIIPAGVRATTLYVGGAGPGNHTTIQGAIDAAMQGDTIFVYNGTYNERLTVDKTLTLVGESRDSTWINGGGTGDTIHVTADWVNLTGFLVLNGGLNPWDAGIELDNVQHCDISGNNFFVNDFDGILLRSSHNNTIANNTVAFNVDIGIYLISSHNNTIVNNNASSNFVGIALDSSDGNVIADNNASDSDSGIYLVYSGDNTITRNNASHNANNGIYVAYSNNTEVKSNTASNNGNDGIHLSFSDANEVSGNVASSNRNDSVRLALSNNNTVTGNTVANSSAGIFLHISMANVIADNVAVDNRFGIHVSDSNHTVLAGNAMVRDGISISGNTLEMWNTHAIDISNTVNGKPVHYWKNATGSTIPPDAGQVILANSTNVMIEHQDLCNGTVGVILGFSSGNAINDNTACWNSQAGVFLASSDNNTLSRNTISGSSYGLYLLSSEGNVIEDTNASGNSVGIFVDRSVTNDFSGNTLSANGYGLYMSSSPDNAFTNGSVSANGYGLYVVSSRDSTFADNTVSLSDVLGIYLKWSNNNTISSNLVLNNVLGIDVDFSDANDIYHNDFISNVDSVNGGPGNNLWDNGYPSGGNYWSDHAGVDFLSGPNQDQPGSDGIGDSPYDVGYGNEDRYPLMSPTIPIPPRAPEAFGAHLSDRNLENVTLTWNISPDDGSGLRSVVGYEIYRGSAYSPDGSGYGHLASLANGTSSFIDNYSGEGDSNNYFYQLCAMDVSNNTVCADSQAAKFTRMLSNGSNLVSIPLLQSNDSTETVLQTVRYDKAWFYDSSSHEWKWFMKHKHYRRGLFYVNHTIGIWIDVTQNSNLTVAGVVPVQTTIHLYEGWNLVSFPSFNVSYTVYDLKTIGAMPVEGYGPSPPYHLSVLGDAEVLRAGCGYWVKAQADADWIVEVS